MEGTDGVATPSDARDHQLRQPAPERTGLTSKLSTDHTLKIADQGGERVRSDRRPEDIMRRSDVRDPIPQRFVDGVLERLLARGHGMNLGTEQPHSLNVRRLAFHVPGPHVHLGGNSQGGADHRRRDPMLARARLGDESSLPHALGE